jgi:signal transduction histidine kinase
VPLTEDIELSPGRTKIDVSYTALSYLAPERVEFRYKLEGFDDEWVSAGTQRAAHYTNVPPGHYRFRVMASNNDGVWNESGATQAFYLKPFFWQRRAFYGVYVLALALAAWLGARIHRRRVRQLEARERELVSLVQERAQAENALKSANRSLEQRVSELARVTELARVSPTGGKAPSRAALPAAPAAGEMGALVVDFNRMLGQLADRERELQQARDALAQEVRSKSRANKDLEQALARLTETQAQLVQSEKLASLGALVAGVAHEINTPVGVSVTAASTLQDGAERVAQFQREGTLTRSELDRFLGVAGESTSILLKNLQRAADLINSFKQVAVDQASGERRRFGFKGYIDEVLLSLAPKLNRTPHSVKVDCPDKLTVDSYPGAIAQILTNLVSNSLVHAFAAGRAGRITIGVRDEGEFVVLRYADDGAGIPRDNLGRIYDPFFTTRRGAGGSGLGLHIVYNLVTQMLGGTITVTSKVGEGTVFEVRFPVQARKAAAAAA